MFSLLSGLTVLPAWSGSLQVARSVQQGSLAHTPSNAE